MKTIQINGQSCATDAATVAELLHEKGLSGKPVAVEKNGEVVPRRAHGESLVCEGDLFEWVTLVGGG